mgnify:CR=1 FL=1
MQRLTPASSWSALVLASALVVMPAVAQQATVYQWTDDQGVPHHGKPVAKVVAYARHAPARTFKVTAEHDEGLQRQAAAAAPAKMTAQEFGVAYKVWIAEQHRIVQDVGIFGAEHRVW